MIDPADRVQRANLNSILAGAETGHYTLPVALHEALKAETRVREALGAARGELRELGSIGQVTTALADDVLEAARADGKPLPGLGARVAEAEEAERRARLALAVMELALEQASYGVLHSISGATIIREHLAPALAETLAVVRKAAPKLAGHDVTAAETFLRASEPVRGAYTAVLDASTRYQALRTGQRAASALAGGPQQDKAGWFAEFRIRDVGRLPEHPIARLLWLAELPEGTVWMASPGEQDQAAAAYFAAADEKRAGRGAYALG